MKFIKRWFIGLLLLKPIKMYLFGQSATNLIIDNRFMAIGRAGWALSEWKNISTSTTVQIMTEFLYIKKSDATAKEIFEYVHKKRPDVPPKSIYSFLSQKDKFSKVSKDTFVPAEWKWKPFIVKRSPRKQNSNTLRVRVQAAVLNYFSKQDKEWVKLSKLKVYVIKLCGCRGQTFYHYLSEMKQIEKEKKPDGVYCRILATTDPKVSENEDWASIIASGESKTG